MKRTFIQHIYKNIPNALKTRGLISKQKRFELAAETVNRQRWITQTVCERVRGHRTSYREGVRGPCGRTWTCCSVERRLDDVWRTVVDYEYPCAGVTQAAALTTVKSTSY